MHAFSSKQQDRAADRRARTAKPIGPMTVDPLAPMIAIDRLDFFLSS
jgi:hypothetical protein